MCHQARLHLPNYWLLCVRWPYCHSHLRDSKIGGQRYWYDPLTSYSLHAFCTKLTLKSDSYSYLTQSSTCNRPGPWKAAVQIKSTQKELLAIYLIVSPAEPPFYYQGSGSPSNRVCNSSIMPVTKLCGSNDTAEMSLSISIRFITSDAYRTSRTCLWAKKLYLMKFLSVDSEAFAALWNKSSRSSTTFWKESLKMPLILQSTSILGRPWGSSSSRGMSSNLAILPVPSLTGLAPTK